MDERPEVWSRYWSQLAERGAAAGSFAGGYAGTVIEDWWRAQMGALAQRRRWLDVATGNGALPQLWSHAVVAEDARCDAVDLARIDAPRWTASLAAAQARRLHWHGGVRAETLPLADATVDVVMSQYGFEYAERAAALAEIARVLVPGGALRLVMHHAGGRPVRLARVEIAQVDELVADDGLWTLACRLIEPFARSATAQGRAALAADPAMEALREAFNRAQERTAASVGVSECPDVLHEASDAVGSLLQRSVEQGPAAGRSYAERWTQRLRDSRLRLAELCAHALDEAALNDLQQRLQALGFNVHARLPLVERGHPMAWALQASKP